MARLWLCASLLVIVLVSVVQFTESESDFRERRDTVAVAVAKRDISDIANDGAPEHRIVKRSPWCRRRRWRRRWRRRRRVRVTVHHRPQVHHHYHHHGHHAGYHPAGYHPAGYHPPYPVHPIHPIVGGHHCGVGYHWVHGSCVLKK